MTDAEKDYRWQAEDGTELEAYKITKGSRWTDQKWPSWLRIQDHAKDDNCVYTDASAPNALFIQIAGAQYQIADGAYITYDAGQLRVQDGQNFERKFSKVVPIPPKEAAPESLPDFELTHRVEGGKLVKLTPEEIEEKRRTMEKPKLRPELVVVDPGVTQLQASDIRHKTAIIDVSKVEIAYELLLDDKTEAAKSVLRSVLLDETQWCACAPGQCTGGPRWSCRQNSPLVK